MVHAEASSWAALIDFLRLEVRNANNINWQLPLSNAANNLQEARSWVQITTEMLLSTRYPKSVSD
jgi:hypothetical protein